jgi:hypothetical protein
LDHWKFPRDIQVYEPSHRRTHASHRPTNANRGDCSYQTVADLGNGHAENEEEDEAFIPDSEDDVSLDAADNNQVSVNELQNIGVLRTIRDDLDVSEGFTQSGIMPDCSLQFLVEEESKNVGVEESLGIGLPEEMIERAPGTMTDEKENDNTLDQRGREVPMTEESDKNSEESKDKMDVGDTDIGANERVNRTHYITRKGCHVKLRSDLYDNYSLLQHVSQKEASKCGLKFQDGQTPSV